MGAGTVLLTGASGLLGTWLRATAPAGTQVVSLTHRSPVAGAVAAVTADLRDPDAVADAMRRAQPSLVLHAAYAHDEASIVDATRHVVDAAAAVGADVLHVSTDAVFSGDGTGRDEHAVPDPVADYGRWKAQAEHLVTSGSPAAAIVRLPLVVSLDPPDHVVQRIRSGAARGEPTTWFVDELRQPALAAELAPALWSIAALDRADRAGVWHLPGPETLSRYEIAQRVVARLGLDPSAIAAEHRPPSSDRPRHLHLTHERATRVLGWSPSPVLR